MLTDWDPEHHYQRQRSLVLRLLPHVIGRGEYFFHSASGLCLTRQRQIEYIWSGKPSSGVYFSQVPTFSRAALTDRQFSRCSSWCGHLYCAATHVILQAIKNRYWPLWYVLWQFVGGHTLQLVRCSLRPELNSQTAYFSPAYPRQVRNP